MNNVVLYVATVLIWGTTWFAIEFQLGVVAPEVSIAYRYLGAAGILFFYSKIRRLRLSFKARHHYLFALMGVTMFCLNYVMAYRAQQHITSALAAIVFSSILWMNIVNARIFFGVRGRPRLYAGALIGMLGILTVFGPQVASISLSDSVLIGSILAMFGALAASFGNMLSQAAQKNNLPVVQSNAWSMLYGALFTGAAAIALGHEFSFDPRAGYVLSLAYLTIFGSVIAFGAYLTLLGRIGAQRAGYATVMFPVVALILSALFEGLVIDQSIVVGFLLVLTGNVLVLSGRKN